MNMQIHEYVEYRSSVADLAVSDTIHCLTGCAKRVHRKTDSQTINSALRSALE